MVDCPVGLANKRLHKFMALTSPRALDCPLTYIKHKGMCSPTIYWTFNVSAWPWRPANVLHNGRLLVDKAFGILHWLFNVHELHVMINISQLEAAGRLNLIADIA